MQSRSDGKGIPNGTKATSKSRGPNFDFTTTGPSSRRTAPATVNFTESASASGSQSDIQSDYTAQDGQLSSDEHTWSSLPGTITAASITDGTLSDEDPQIQGRRVFSVGRTSYVGGQYGVTTREIQFLADAVPLAFPLPPKDMSEPRPQFQSFYSAASSPKFGRDEVYQKSRGRRRDINGGSMSGSASASNSLYHTAPSGTYRTPPAHFGSYVRRPEMARYGEHLGPRDDTDSATD